MSVVFFMLSCCHDQPHNKQNRISKSIYKDKHFN